MTCLFVLEWKAGSVTFLFSVLVGGGESCVKYRGRNMLDRCVFLPESPDIFLSDLDTPFSMLRLMQTYGPLHLWQHVHPRDEFVAEERGVVGHGST